MKLKKGKFMVFDVSEFAVWLDSQQIHRYIRLVQNHHTWNPSYQHFKGDNHLALLAAMENAHIERGFSEIAQNITTFPDGTVAVCRALDKIPAGIKGANTSAVCIENLGNFDAGKDAMSAAHKDSIVQTNALLCTRFKLKADTSTIVYHHWYDLDTGEKRDGLGNTKTCPGTGFFGGNSVEDALAGFIPLVKEAIMQNGRGGAAKAKDILYKGRVSAGVLNVRDMPDLTGRVLRRLRKGVVVVVYEWKGDWGRIHPSDACWVNRSYLEEA
ncbi:N-acetylmuramoyl-L-alanine amidase [Syntrophorhabdus aromaticivorans]|uniref:Amidase n=1 Tax=Syntrophorhabdus aromaticivorans TaxID=328301 RepID=A0A971M4M0_9BACT|nr:amidase [Syntrophorhabdus aromaticivorans]NLW35768.1 amidase [Syntrophorhabdus aromaticivorans]